jgi:hypothetical protein
MKQPEQAGLVSAKTESVTLTTGKVAIQFRYRAEDFPTQTAGDCAAVTFEDSSQSSEIRKIRLPCVEVSSAVKIGGT